ncbi:Rv3654c family TadE-like protein [Arthrobacter sp. NQ4]|uniref:Rv3654c family TadE-like protein n=2 Tax=Micrococcaceae TaxID=1268 RepID=UPI0027E36306|nr:Rv3654c family TadE-like protein [Arthrobacter sp. NQ4]
MDPYRPCLNTQRDCGDRRRRQRRRIGRCRGRQVMGDHGRRHPTIGTGHPCAGSGRAAPGRRHATRRRYARGGRRNFGPGQSPQGATDGRERGSGTVLAAGLALVVMTAMAVMLLLAQSAVLASRAAAAADLAALAAADALRGITTGDPCAVAVEVAARHSATVLSCSAGPGQTIEVRTELGERALLGAATGRARAGPPP